jgi:hypothetical protein
MGRRRGIRRIDAGDSRNSRGIKRFHTLSLSGNAMNLQPASFQYLTNSGPLRIVPSRRSNSFFYKLLHTPEIPTSLESFDYTLRGRGGLIV